MVFYIKNLCSSRSYDREETTYFEINSCGQNSSPKLLRRDYKSSHMETSTITSDLRTNQSVSKLSRNCKEDSNIKETWYRKRNDSQGLSDSFKQGNYPSKLPRLCSNVLTRKTVSLPVLKNRSGPGSPISSSNNSSPQKHIIVTKDSTKLPVLKEKSAPKGLNSFHWTENIKCVEDKPKPCNLIRQSPREQRSLLHKSAFDPGVKPNKRHKLLPIKSEPALKYHSSSSAKNTNKIQKDMDYENVETGDVFVDNLEDFCQWKASNGREFKTYTFREKPKSKSKDAFEHTTREYEDACKTLESIVSSNTR